MALPTQRIYRIQVLHPHGPSWFYILRDEETSLPVTATRNQHCALQEGLSLGKITDLLLPSTEPSPHQPVALAVPVALLPTPSLLLEKAS